MSGSSGTGIVLASYGRGALVQSGAETLSCALRGRKQRVVCGDRVHWVSGEADGGPAIDALEPRRNLLERIDARGRPEPVAANLDRVAMVVACEPLPDWFVVDRYWAGARLKDIEALLIVNKSDLSSDDLAVELANYRMLGLPCVEASARNRAGLAALRAALADGATLLVGQSGVGKSSLVNLLVPDAAAQTAELTREVEGRHTTTTARRYRLPSGPESQSAVIDAPGVLMISHRPPASRAPPSAASSRFTGAPPIAVSAIADTSRSRNARCAMPCSRSRSRLSPALPAVPEAGCVERGCARQARARACRRRHTRARRPPARHQRCGKPRPGAARARRDNARQPRLPRSDSWRVSPRARRPRPADVRTHRARAPPVRCRQAATSDP